jgi:superfamily II DNA helicase RecQ
LRGIAEARPSTLAELSRIAGVGETKLQRYGAAMLAALATASGEADGARA